MVAREGSMVLLFYAHQADTTPIRLSLKTPGVLSFGRPTGLVLVGLPFWWYSWYTDS
jgi:hypothetical protein